MARPLLQLLLLGSAVLALAHRLPAGKQQPTDEADQVRGPSLSRQLALAERPEYPGPLDLSRPRAPPCPDLVRSYPALPALVRSERSDYGSTAVAQFCQPSNCCHATVA